MSDPRFVPGARFVPGVRPPDGGGGAVARLWFVFRGRELLVTPRAEPLSAASLEELDLEPLRTHYLGQLDGLHCHSAELPGDASATGDRRFMDLRRLYGRMDETHHAVAGRAVQILEWDRTHQFCGACGDQTELSDVDRSRVCKRCGLSQFPRLAPAMIVAVERGDELLLGRGPQFPPGIYSVLAGFVEPGESLEDAVHREVFEETGIEVDDVRYFGSQPWPYPNSLMLGFQARYSAGDIHVDGVEIEDAGWFRADEFPRVFPGNMSISQWLIGDFVRRQRESG